MMWKKVGRLLSMATLLAVTTVSTVQSRFGMKEGTVSQLQRKTRYPKKLYRSSGAQKVDFGGESLTGNVIWWAQHAGDSSDGEFPVYGPTFKSTTEDNKEGPALGHDDGNGGRVYKCTLGTCRFTKNMSLLLHPGCVGLICIH